ncbi:2-dehydro-3-deoxygalactonokinase [Sulfitobacter sp. S190]|uniref:2-dehydro-3-deoxygalactonokinase n=1 Tax=Sulfitobacter sp. S190 TaxID=2867022 RepID=UPI0021A62FF7|nr:2-dehydro-3-deoxygalactonokinase [Sulfitobacter sp. S190]UWR24466.1 2-dehydro-3-deoxygalactonokinase [Sulfitobacter sp. S190]
MRWIAVDWGTSNLRAWVMQGDAVQAALSSADGMGTLARDGFEPALLRLVGDHLQDGSVTPVICCGMVGARQGWIEAAYQTVPSSPPQAAQSVSPVCDDPRLSVSILPGMSQASPADVMRGEETQIAGFLAAFPDFDGVLCLPGTHSKWAHISAGEVVSFRTFMTGELYALLSRQSVLKHSIPDDGWDDAAFTDAVGDAMSRPERVVADLFSLRAQGLVSTLDPAVARARLSGMLVGMELAAARPYWLGQNVALVGNGTLSQRYSEALAAQGVTAQTTDAEEMTLRGLRAAFHSLSEGA